MIFGVQNIYLLYQDILRIKRNLVNFVIIMLKNWNKNINVNVIVKINKIV